MSIAIYFAKRSYLFVNLILCFKGEACGKPHQVPYSKGGFEVIGLPEGIAFKKPGQYGLKQVRQIMEQAENIKFVITDHGQATNDHALEWRLNEKERETYIAVLKKIVDDEKVASCILKNELIEESDLEVTNLDLSKIEFNMLTMKLSHLFHTDAQTTLIANYESSKVHNGFILPTYTETDEPETYWLFYHPGSAEAIEDLTVEEKIWGYWLDKTNGALTYHLMKNKTFIVGLNLICYQEKELCSIRLKKNISDGQITIPSSFDKAILECLAKQGFL